MERQGENDVVAVIHGGGGDLGFGALAYIRKQRGCGV